MRILLVVESNNDRFLYNISLKQFRWDKYYEKHKNTCFLHHPLVANGEKHVILKKFWRFSTAQDFFWHNFKSGKLAFHL